jgi:hypothetical protein
MTINSVGFLQEITNRSETITSIYENSLVLTHTLNDIKDIIDPIILELEEKNYNLCKRSTLIHSKLSESSQNIVKCLDSIQIKHDTLSIEEIFTNPKHYVPMALTCPQSVIEWNQDYQASLESYALIGELRTEVQSYCKLSGHSSDVTDPYCTMANIMLP